MQFGAAIAALWALLCGAGLAQDAPRAAPSVDLVLMTDDIRVAPDGSLVQTSHMELRALNEAGTLQASRIDLPFNAGLQKIEIVEAYTRKADGTKVPVNPGTIVEQLPQDSPQIGMVTDQRVKVLLFPQFAAGDTAVYTIRLKAPRPVFANEFIYGDVFPRTVAVREMRESITVPAAMGVRVESHDIQYEKKEEGASTTYTWHYSAPGAKAAETVLVSPIDREPRFFLSSFKNYAELGRAYASLSQPKIVVTPKIKALADRIAGNEAGGREKARKLYEWVAKNIRYVAVELGNGTMVPHDVDDILTNGYGDCKDHDVLLQALLKAEGIGAQSVLINATNAYTLTEVPTFVQLDHVITYVPELDAYLDSSISLAPFGTLPFALYGKPAVYVSQANASLSTLPVLKPGVATLTVATNERLDSLGNLSGTMKTTATGPYTIDMRLLGLIIQASGPEAFAATQLAVHNYKDGKGKFAADPPTELGSSYAITGEFTASGWSSWLAGDANTLPDGLLAVAVPGETGMGPFHPGDLKESEATVCFSAHNVEDISLELPAGVTVKALPADSNVATRNLRFTAHWSFAGGKLSVHRDFSSTIDKPLCQGAVRSDTAAALKKISDSYDVQVQLVRSIADLSKDVAAKPGDVDALIRRGLAYTDNGQYELALQDIEQALKLAPDNTWALNARGLTYYRSGKYEPASKDFDKAIALEPDYQVAHYNRGLVYFKMEDYAHAIEEYNTAAALDPNDASVLIDRGLAYVTTHDTDRALGDLDKAIALKPDSAYAYGVRCAAYLEARKPARAIQDCTEALRLDPTYAWALNKRMEAYKAVGDKDSAADDYAALLSTDPKYSDALRAHALSFCFKGEIVRCLQLSEVNVALHPNNDKALELRGNAHRALKQYDLALEDLKKAIALNPDGYGLHIALVRTLFSLHKPDLAQKHCEELLAAHPDKGWPLLVCSNVKRINGDDKGANRDVGKALKIEPGLENGILYVYEFSSQKSK